MLNYIWPLLLVVAANTLYQICAKEVPSQMNPFASLTITYCVGMVTSLILFFVLGKNLNLLAEYKKANWASFTLGIVIVGLEVGYIFMYKAGWPVSIAQIVQAVIITILLIFIGFALYKEQITWNKVLGILVCLAGLGLINLK